MHPTAVCYISVDNFAKLFSTPLIFLFQDAAVECVGLADDGPESLGDVPSLYEEVTGISFSKHLSMGLK